MEIYFFPSKQFTKLEIQLENPVESFSYLHYSQLHHQVIYNVHSLNKYVSHLSAGAHQIITAKSFPPPLQLPLC